MEHKHAKKMDAENSKEEHPASLGAFVEIQPESVEPNDERAREEADETET